MTKPEPPSKVTTTRKHVIVVGNSLSSVLELLELDKARPGITITEPKFGIEYYQGGGSNVVLEWFISENNSKYDKEYIDYLFEKEKYIKYLQKVAKEKERELKVIAKEIEDLE